MICTCYSLVCARKWVDASCVCKTRYSTRRWEIAGVRDSTGHPVTSSSTFLSPAHRLPSSPKNHRPVRTSVPRLFANKYTYICYSMSAVCTDSQFRTHHTANPETLRGLCTFGLRCLHFDMFASPYTDTHTHTHHTFTLGGYLR